MNFRFSARMVYALIALKHIGDGVITLHEIASKYPDMSLHFLEQIMRTLRDSGIVRSIRGPGGGYTLGKSSRTVTLRDIVLLFEPGERYDRYVPEEIVKLERIARDRTLKALEDCTLLDFKRDTPFMYVNYNSDIIGHQHGS